MKVYQTIHKYAPHIPLFEKNYGITDETDFESLQRFLIEDGYASTYTLYPALQHKTNEVFFTIWDYERLQWKWAEEKGLKTHDLDKIKLAQIEEFKPDVFYNLSAFYDKGFIHKLGKNKKRKDVCWNGIIQDYPMTFPAYDGHLSLHRPYIDIWKDQGFKALELQPHIPDKWKSYNQSEKNTDVLFYGQYVKDMFDNRNKLIQKLLEYSLISNYNIDCHLSYTKQGQTLFKIPKLSWTRISTPFTTFPNKFVRKYSKEPLYGKILYEKIVDSKIVINAYTNYNNKFKSNMRLFEAIGLGAFLISEEGVYPDGFEPGTDFYTYRNSTELISQIERVLSDWPKHQNIADRTRKKITSYYNKSKQWQIFQEFIKVI